MIHLYQILYVYSYIVKFHNIFTSYLIFFQAKEFKSDKEMFEFKAKQFTKKHANISSANTE